MQETCKPCTCMPISACSSLSGALSCEGSLHGQLSVGGRNAEKYEGIYRVVPKARRAQMLPTENKLLKENIVVTEVPFFETENDANGKTVYIAKEV